MELGTVGEHHPNFLPAGAAGLKDDMAAVGRPGWRIVASAIVSELYPLLAGNIHQIDVTRARLAGAILASPGQSKELAIRRPAWVDGIALIGHALQVGAVGFHGVDLGQA